MKDLLTIGLLLGLSVCGQSRYVEGNINENPFMCMNECQEDEDILTHEHKNSSLK